MIFAEFITKIIIFVKYATIATTTASRSINPDFYYSSYLPKYNSKMDDRYFTVNRVSIDHYVNRVPTPHHLSSKNNNYKLRRQGEEGLHTHTNYRHPFEVSTSSGSHEPKPCDGFGNFLIDVGIVSFIFSVVSAGFGLYTLILANINQFVSYAADYFVSVPSSILTVITLVNSNEFLLAVNTLWGLGSVVVSGVTTLIGLPFNDHINYFSALAELLGIISLLIGIASTFPDLFEEFLNTFIDPHEYFKEYMCAGERFLNAQKRSFLIN